MWHLGIGWKEQNLRGRNWCRHVAELRWGGMGLEMEIEFSCI